jgi:site-specific DNA-methyltransferase (cytosine-N4-specific)
LKTNGSIPSNFIEQPLLETSDEIPDSVIRVGNNAANDKYTVRCKETGSKIHPARFPRTLPEFFIKMLTDKGDLVMDTFAGSNTTGAVAEDLGRRWIAFESVEEYLEASKFRFD